MHLKIWVLNMSKKKKFSFSNETLRVVEELIFSYQTIMFILNIWGDGIRKNKKKEIKKDKDIIKRNMPIV